MLNEFTIYVHTWKERREGKVSIQITKKSRNSYSLLTLIVICTLWMVPLNSLWQVMIMPWSSVFALNFNVELASYFIPCFMLYIVRPANAPPFQRKWGCSLEHMYVTEQTMSCSTPSKNSVFESGVIEAWSMAPTIQYNKGIIQDNTQQQKWQIYNAKIQCKNITYTLHYAAWKWMQRGRHCV